MLKKRNIFVLKGTQDQPDPPDDPPDPPGDPGGG